MMAAVVRYVMMARVMMTRMMSAVVSATMVTTAAVSAAVSAAAREHLSCHQANRSHRQHEPKFAIHFEYLSQQIQLG
jgi:hypothetical protein